MDCEADGCVHFNRYHFIDVLLLSCWSFDNNVCWISSNWVLAGAAVLCLSAGKVYFEVEVCSAVGKVVVGFAGTNFLDEYVGKDRTSWGIEDNGDQKHQ